ncbi:DMT family transporter [Arthrobacter sp. MYb213]|uniref:DMT family transporter n=1 Tax=Arthrobacter sp. MYb213 TaxID=1848595 RepID=UPI002570F758|nr:DMT family transporter [Arthrobacter sp. MYb213]
MNQSVSPALSPGTRLAYLIIAVATGLLMPIQSRVNGALGVQLADPFAAALVSFVGGLVALTLIHLLLPGPRRAAQTIPRVIRQRQFPWWYLAAGMVGAFVVVSQSTAVPIVGVALFTVSLVTGQTVGSMIVDRLGFGPAGPRKISALRMIGALLTVVGVLWAVSPRIVTDVELGTLLFPMVFSLIVGVLMGYQSASNGVQAQAYGNPLTATLMNFVVGTLMLGMIILIRLPIASTGGNFPTQWWFYVGGLLGCVFIGVSAFMVKHLGVLFTGLCMICGQLLGSLLLDLVVPTAGSHISFATVAGTVLTLLAVALASVSGSGKTRRNRG